PFIDMDQMTDRMMALQRRFDRRADFGLALRIAASPRSAMGCRAASALPLPRPTGRLSRSPAMAGST
ncbi:MAG TPA: hypothetical protein VKI44_21065, partial [Acetobacteraceae bacterium]|nr:hypothetical protein [Acetobacteraceae bacterium]